MVNGWTRVESQAWEPKEYALWSVVSFEGRYYTLTSLDGFDNNLPPTDSIVWGEIADYDAEYNSYDLSGHDYVVYNGEVFWPEMDVNADEPTLNINLVPKDPRNYNIKKHMVRLAIYELSKLISPNNVSVVRLRDYEDSMKWLYDAGKIKLNPQIPRKLTADKQPVTDWQLATYQTACDPNNNPWLT